MNEILKNADYHELEQLAGALRAEHERRHGGRLLPLSLPARCTELAAGLDDTQLENWLRMTFYEMAGRLLQDVRIRPAGSIDRKGLIPEGSYQLSVVSRQL